MLETVPGTNQDLTMKVKFLAQGKTGPFDGAQTHD